MRRTAEATRRRLLDVGLALLHERGPAPAVGHIRLSSVLRRAGLTTGAAYRIWGGQLDYHRDLALEAVRYREAESNARTVAAVLPVLLDPEGTWQEAIRRGSEVNVRSYPTDVAFLTTQAVRAGANGDAELIEAGAVRHEEALDAHARSRYIFLRCLLRGRLGGSARRQSLPPAGPETPCSPIACRRCSPPPSP